jgi:hypothetical protein
MNMPHKIYYTLTQSAAATGKHKSTILRAVQADKIEHTKDVHGNYKISAESLHAVYPRATLRTDADSDEPGDFNTESVSAPLRNDSATVANATERNDAMDTPDAIVRNAAEALRNDERTIAQLKSEQVISEQKSQQIEDLRATISDLQKRLDKADDERKVASAVAADQIEKFQQLIALNENKLREQVVVIEHQQSALLEHEQKQNAGWFKRAFSRIG